ncbi:FAD-dependent oxidoreductase [Elizabethkingia miricola]|uniref:FAD-dependent oxidoreductase n=1 Tax=Elizabethkingia miricola TaxID=172045 RepID=A0AAQ1PJ18_ELIMR|nr:MULTISPECIES: FAD-binding oxidoreductase [Elizabethkingia]KUY17021.1 FAD-dependent oxidoreductase [Elizabethkingia miricola]MCL1654693.1 FAD-binding oxidoreductase [Elizabethkingia miricola]MCL1680561.1 FAD-binding oxidoreductase [Elizabethkingia miricola]OPC34793.1 FAD-dependent oxidoreductase [Elizabethkingia miricola]OPC72429.1 FAD-dependent oxidoreductase [Elizabethkingia miricola]
MEKLDYIIVGDGYAAMFFAHQLLKSGKTFKLFSEGNRAASHISAGVCNPVVLKRYNKIWNDEAQMDYLPVIFDEIEEYLHKNYLIQENVVRVFHDEGEHKLWLKKASQEKFEDYLDSNIQQLSSVENPFGVGRVKNSCRLDVRNFFTDFFNLLDEKNALIKERFNYDKLSMDQYSYNDYTFDKIIFAEGTGIKDNPYFCEIPVKPNKGHRFSLRLEKDTEAFVIKKKHFLFRFSGDEYYYGGTYDRDSENHEIEEKAVEELKKGLEEVYKSSYEIDEISTAFRATVADRRPIIGRHEIHQNLYIFNGLGARGVLNGSYFSKQLFDFIEHGIEFHEEVDVKRFSQIGKIS